jgi:hypothetical protein
VGFGTQPGTLHQPPDLVNPILLLAISQIEMDLAIPINATGLQPELFDLACQPEPDIHLMPWLIRLLSQA